MKTYIVDSFTNEAFKGNPAGVCFPSKALSDTQMLLIAQELGLSETAFVQATEQESVYTIRYFSPKMEIPLCGHATLAAAKVIFDKSEFQAINFITVAQLNLFVNKQDEEIVMSFPIYDTVSAEIPAASLAALGINEVINTVYSAQNKIILLEISDAATLAQLNPDFNALVASHTGINGILVTAPSDTAEYDYHYRYFWPWAGTNEDPVTGGVQTFLAKYWSERLGKQQMKAFQSSSRTGYMNVALQDDKVLLISKAVIIFEGQLLAFD